MNDPWVGKRDLVKHAAMSDNSWPRMLGEALEEVLDDADALLAVKDAAKELAPHTGTDKDKVLVWRSSYFNLVEALAALPEHLRRTK